MRELHPLCGHPWAPKFTNGNLQTTEKFDAPHAATAMAAAINDVDLMKPLGRSRDRLERRIQDTVDEAEFCQRRRGYRAPTLF